MRVGLNLMFLGERAGGIGRLVTELLSALALRDDVEVVAFVCADAPAEIFAVPGAQRVRYVKVPVHRPGSPPHLLAHLGLVPALALALRCDVLHSPGNAGPVRIPGLPCAISLHDVIWRRAGEDWGDPAARAAMERYSVPMVRHADRVLTGSAHAADDVAAEIGIPRDRIDVVSNGVRVDLDAPATPEAELRARLELGGAPVLLCVAQKRPYKNQESLVRALAARPAGDALLVLPGAPTAYEEQLRALAAELGVAGRVRFVDWVSDADLEALYRLATAVLLPSRLEGFGLPVLEAMARGVPVVCSSTTSLGEVAGDAALLVDPDDQPGIDAAVARVLDDAPLRHQLSAAGRTRAAAFTWEAVGGATVEAYRRTVAARRARRR
ncbi:MAG TPA: glycosyltransferase family 1 protein [Baekduia sp.]|jgi:glycosyltransferase involved in cell wall biosynthesis